MDQSKKTMRHFYCRDVLWETFEQMANDFDCSIDYLVNEAMRYYARSKNYQSPGAPPGGTGGAPIANAGANNSGGVTYPKNSGAPTGAGSPGRAPPGTQPPPNPAPGGSPGSGARRPLPPTPGYAGNANAGGANRPMMNAGGMGNGGLGVNGPSVHAPAPQVAPTPPPMGGGGNVGTGGPTLFLVYNGQRYPVTKDQFIIGRGSKTSDLAIKDGNISRKHAAVIRRNGTFYIKDLGSTNGIDYKGMRIDNKRIDEGDVFHLCDYELRFTYRAD
jgi:hypothetical protein